MKPRALAWLLAALLAWVPARAATPPQKLLLLGSQAPAIDLNFANGVDPRIVYTGQNGTYFNSSGVLTAATTNVPRIDWSLGYPAMLVEESRQNILTQSNGLVVSPWALFASAITANSSISPDGTSDASLVTPSAQEGGPFFTINVTGSTTYTYSAWIKWVSGNTANIGLGYYDAQNSLQHPHTSTITSSWVRYIYTFTTASNTTSVSAQIYDNNTSGFGTFLVYGAQLELGAFATSYIPTVGSAVTRAADLATVPTSAFRFNPKAGTLVARSSLAYASPSYPGIVTIDDGSVNNDAELLISNGTFAGSDEFVSGSFAFAPGSVAYTNGSVLHSGIAWSTVSARQGINGAVVTGSTSALPALSTMRIGQLRGGGNFFNGLISRLQYYPYAMSASQLANATK